MESFRIRFVLGLIALSLGHVSGAVDTDSIFFRHYKRDGSHNDVNINEVTQLSSELNFNEWTMCHLHGFTESTDSESVTMIVRAYLKATKRNVIAIDYRKIAGNINYFADVKNANLVGKAIANALNQLVAHGLDPNKIHVIGHSLGAQVAGYVGSDTNFRIPRITGLDPAGPMFYKEGYLKSGDAQFVDIIHTDKAFLGQTQNSGDADFEPNGGHRPQPGCPAIPFEKTKEGEAHCNHHRSWKYYAESVLNPDGFMAIQCNNSFAFDFGICNHANVVPMGFATPTSADLSYKEFAAENASQIVQLLALSNRTLLHCHGYTQSPDDTDVITLITNYVEGTNHNIIVADYRYVTYSPYATAVALTEAVAGVLCKAVEDMVLAGMNKYLLVVVGFSMGAQIAGTMARNLSFELPQLVGLDPAGPLYNNTLKPSLTVSDAACVKCIHTDDGYYGSATVCGHQDYYPNNGTRYHPGCPTSIVTDPVQACSHYRGEYYGGETAKYPNSYLAIECNSWDDFKAGNCNSSNIISMGLDAPCSAKGKFYFQTNYQSPFGLGQAGLTYNETLANIH